MTAATLNWKPIDEMSDDVLRAVTIESARPKNPYWVCMQCKRSILELSFAANRGFCAMCPGSPLQLRPDDLLFVKSIDHERVCRSLRIGILPNDSVAGVKLEQSDAHAFKLKDYRQQAGWKLLIVYPSKHFAINWVAAPVVRYCELNFIQPISPPGQALANPRLKKSANPRLKKSAQPVGM